MDEETINSVIGVPWRLTDGRWTGQKFVWSPATAICKTPIFRGKETQDIDEFGATVGCPGCNEITDNKRARAHSDRYSAN